MFFWDVFEMYKGWHFFATLRSRIFRLIFTLFAKCGADAVFSFTKDFLI